MPDKYRTSEPHRGVKQESDTSSRPRAVIVSTVPQTIRIFLAQQIRHLGDAGFDLHAIASPEPDWSISGAPLEIPFHGVSMKRTISPLSDCIAIWNLAWELRRIKPDIVQTHTPKAGLLGMIAAVAARVPIRIYTVNGVVWESVPGWRGILLRCADRTSASLASRVICVSHSVRDAILARRICKPQRAAVLGRGGSHGVDLERFDPRRFPWENRRQVRERRGLPVDGLVLGFVGRFVNDKGFETLLGAWRKVRSQVPGAILFLVGERELSHPVNESLWAEVTGDPRIVVAAAPPDHMPEIYSAMDILILPTLREGLPNVLLEAGAMEVPVIATRATGCIDVVLEGETGLLVPIRGTEELASAVLRLATDCEFRRQMGASARKHIAAFFSEKVVSEKLVDEYRRLLSESCTTPPLNKVPEMPYRTVVKPLADRLLALIALLVLSPLLLALAILIKARMGSPVLFRQVRIGMNNDPFVFMKFRTMTNETDGNGCLLPDEKRLTRFGRFLRFNSLDEIPQFWNVATGDMSLIGPRPLLPEYLPRYSTSQARRHEVKPGITGLAQVKGRNSLTWEEKFELDVYYVDHCGLSLDLRIAWMTFASVIRREGISERGHATASPFTGSKREESNREASK